MSRVGRTWAFLIGAGLAWIAQGAEVKATAEHPVPNALEPLGKANTIAVQVFNVDGGGGILGPQVRLVAEAPTK